MSEIDEFTAQQYFRLKDMLDAIRKVAVDIEGYEMNDKVPCQYDNPEMFVYTAGYNAAMQKIREVLNGSV
jgi:hypothetical protein